MGYASDFCGTAGRLVGPPFSNKRHKGKGRFPCTGRFEHHHPSATFQGRSTRISPPTDLFGSVSTRSASLRQVANARSQRQGTQVSRALLTRPAADRLPVLPDRRIERLRLPWSGRSRQVCKDHEPSSTRPKIQPTSFYQISRVCLGSVCGGLTFSDSRIS